MKKMLQKWNLAFMAVCGVLGSIIGLTIIYLTTGKFNFSSLLGFLSGAAILLIINIIKVLIKKDKTPETDERIRKNLIKYLLYSSHIFIGLLFLALTLISFIGFETISLFYLWIIITAYLWISGIGGFIVGRR